MIYILFHCKSTTPFRPCMDGLFAGAIAKLTLPDSVIVPACYGKPPKLTLVEGDKIYLLDLSYPHGILSDWIAQGANVQMIDHHKTAKTDLDGWLNNGFDSVFEMQKSGAMLAWEYFNPDKPAPDVIRYVQDRDIWTKALPDCDLCSLGLAEECHGKSVDEAIEMAIAAVRCDKVGGYIALGKVVAVEVEAAIQSAISRATHRIIGGYLVPFVRVRGDREKQAYSDIGNRLLKEYPEAPFACVGVGAGWALRSEKGREDVSIIAKRLGGGGHACASGCEGDNPLIKWKSVSIE